MYSIFCVVGHLCHLEELFHANIHILIFAQKKRNCQLLLKPHFLTNVVKNVYSIKENEIVFIINL